MILGVVVFVKLFGQAENCVVLMIDNSRIVISSSLTIGSRASLSVAS